MNSNSFKTKFNFKIIEISSTLLSTVINILLLLVILNTLNTNVKNEELIEIGFGVPGGGSGGSEAGQLNVDSELKMKDIAGNNEKNIAKEKNEIKKDKLDVPEIKNKDTEDKINQNAKNINSEIKALLKNEVTKKGKGVSGDNPEGTGTGSGHGIGSGNGNGNGNGSGNGEGEGYSIDFGGRIRKIYSYKIPEYPLGVDKNINIILKFNILPDGTVGTILPLIKADNRLENAAINSLRQWRFEPIPTKQKQFVQTAVITFPFRIR